MYQPLKINLLNFPHWFWQSCALPLFDGREVFSEEVILIFKPYPVPLQSSNVFLGLLLRSAASVPECCGSSPSPETSGWDLRDYTMQSTRIWSSPQVFHGPSWKQLLPWKYMVSENPHLLNISAWCSTATCKGPRGMPEPQWLPCKGSGPLQVVQNL